MKLKHLILFFSLILAACSSRHPVETLVIPSESGNIASPNKQLQAIDSLMWRQPDSALMVLVDFAATPKADSLSAFEGHYCQMLLSELLYKNDYGQSNREKLLKVVGCFDSIVGTDETDARKADTRGVSLRERNAFLDARAHYINGVGFYERDSVVETCEEYLKALEVMDLNFEEKGLEGNKAIFMANIYNRLGDFFSVQFMMDDAIACYEQALLYCLKEPTSSNGVSNILYHIGIQYDKKDSLNIARQYYGQALETVSNIDNLTYRNIVTSKALCDYQIEKKAEQPLNALRTIIGQTENEDERLTRYLTVGDIFFEEQMFDSAMFFLELAFGNNKDKSMQVQAADFLRIIYDSLGDSEKSNNCLKFMADNMKLEGENKALVSQLDNLFQDYLKQKQGKQTEAEHTKHIKRIVGIIVPIIVLLVLGVIVIAKLRSNKLLKQQQKEAEQELRLLQAEADKALEKSKRKHEEELRQLQDVSEKTLKEIQKKHDLALETVQADNALTAKKAKESLAERLKLIYKASTMNRNKVISDENDFEKVKRYLFGAKDATVWDAMKHCMDETYPNLYAQMAEAYPMFSDVELKICLLSAFKFRTDEIADIAELKNGTVSTYKTNIRKKVQNLPIDHIAEQFMD